MMTVGHVLEPLHLTDASGRAWDVPGSAPLHLQLRRFAGCPACTLHLAAYAGRIDEVRAAGLESLVVFRSSRAAVEPHAGSLPFPLIPDPDGRLYARFGARSSVRAVSDPRAWGHLAAGVRQGVSLPEQLGASLILPVDAIVDRDGTVLALHRAAHAGDGWSVDELLTQFERWGPST